MIPGSIAVVSGKGGAGKTMLSMAITHELAIRKRTLILDLDIFNRGLSGLLKTGKTLAELNPPDFVTAESETEPASGGWRLIEAERNVVTLVYPDVNRAQRQKMESLSVLDLSAQLEAFVRDLMALSNCELVLLDCHGGPDILSFAAVSICARTILVSEPDRVTFYGTLHFLRRMAEDCPNPSPDIRLVFNKVMPAFSERYLQRFYDSHVKDLFGGQALLAVVPFEGYLSKEFERSPFVTAVFPYSQLANKTRQIVHALGIVGRPPRRNAGEHIASFISRAIGGGANLVPRFMDLNLVTTVAAVALLLYLWVELPPDLGGAARTPHFAYLDTASTDLATLVGLWYLQALLLNWASSLDRIITRLVRVRNFTLALPVFFVLEPVGILLAFVPIFWALFCFTQAGILKDAAPGVMAKYLFVPSFQTGHLAFVGAYFLTCVVLWAATCLVMRTIIAIWHERRRVEGSLRVASLLIAALLPIITVAAIISTNSQNARDPQADGTSLPVLTGPIEASPPPAAPRHSNPVR